MTRDQRVAHLEIHGWRPMKNLTSERFGIYNDSVGIGFSVRNDPAEPVGDSSVKRWDRAHAMDSYIDCPWDEVTDWHLNMIDARLREV